MSNVLHALPLCERMPVASSLVPNIVGQCSVLKAADRAKSRSARCSVNAAYNLTLDQRLTTNHLQVSLRKGQ